MRHQLLLTNNSILNKAGERISKPGPNPFENTNTATDTATNSVFYLSNRKLSATETKLLINGLKFVPTEKANFDNVLTDLKEWERRMRLHEYFSELNMEKEHSEILETNNNNQNENSKRTKGITWTTESGRNRWLDIYIDEVKDDIIKGICGNKHSNLSKRERNAFKKIVNEFFE